MSSRIQSGFAASLDRFTWLSTRLVQKRLGKSCARSVSPDAFVYSGFNVSQEFCLLSYPRLTKRRPPDFAERCPHFAASMCHVAWIDILVPRLLPRNTLLSRLLPREIVSGGRSLHCSAFQGWSPGTRVDSLIPSRVEYKSRSSRSRDSARRHNFCRWLLRTR